MATNEDRKYLRDFKARADEIRRDVERQRVADLYRTDPDLVDDIIDQVTDQD